MCYWILKMNITRCLIGGLICLLAMIDIVKPLCVLESDFGFKINCAFKKSGLFRVRNLGGIKAHASLGFSLGDELGFDQSLTNQDPSRRRSVSVRNGAPNAFVDTTNRPAAKQEKRGKQNRIMMRPVPSPARPNQAAMSKLTTLHKRVSTMQPIVVPSADPLPNRAITMAKPMPMGVPPFRPLPPKEETLKVLPIAATRKTYSPLQVPQSKPEYTNPVPQQVQDLAYYNTKKADDYNTISGYSDDTTLKINKDDINAKIAEIAKAGNISMEAVEAAIALRQQQLLSKYANIPVPTTTTTEAPIVFELEPEPEIVVAPAPSKPKRNPTTGKVMNAPREYYPVGYEKNFDDQFQSKVDLPDTNFHCGDQKYFPGLYGDTNLGCMVFHVCALTDDGLVMKSFLCPESTLFDQTILKCNWWFYVDCKSTASLYDTNIPVSKSYQLMKALTFFSSYKKEMEDGRPSNPEDMDGIKEAITILENQDSKPSNSDRVEIVTPSPLIDERNNKKEEIAPIYRGHRELNNTERTIQKDSKLITLSSGFNFNNNSRRNERRRISSRTYARSTTTTTTTEKPETTTDNQEINQEELRTEELEKKEELTDQIDSESILREAEKSAPVRRLYRSSAEGNQEIKLINNEKVQIVRPTAYDVTKLDDAILGKFRRLAGN